MFLGPRLLPMFSNLMNNKECSNLMNNKECLGDPGYFG